MESNKILGVNGVTLMPIIYATFNRRFLTDSSINGQEPWGYKGSRPQGMIESFFLTLFHLLNLPLLERRSVFVGIPHHRQPSSNRRTCTLLLSSKNMLVPTMGPINFTYSTKVNTRCTTTADTKNTFKNSIPNHKPKKKKTNQPTKYELQCML